LSSGKVAFGERWMRFDVAEDCEIFLRKGVLDLGPGTALVAEEDGYRLCSAEEGLLKQGTASGTRELSNYLVLFNCGAVLATMIPQEKFVVTGAADNIIGPHSEENLGGFAAFPAAGGVKVLAEVMCCFEDGIDACGIKERVDLSDKAICDEAGGGGKVIENDINSKGLRSDAGHSASCEWVKHETTIREIPAQDLGDSLWWDFRVVGMGVICVGVLAR
jgi:hypothetical protein